MISGLAALRLLQSLTLCCAALLMPQADGAQSGTRRLNDPVSGKPVRYAGKYSGGEVRVPVKFVPKRGELRGVWVATEQNIDMPVSGSAEAFKREYLTMLNNIKSAGFNAIFFQVRPKNDAFYPSRVNPWSRHLSGEEGRGLGFDPLRFMIDEAHRRGIEFHAWLNPYRVVGSTRLRKAAYLRTLHKDNYIKPRGYLALEFKNSDGSYGVMLNPGEPRVMRFILYCVRELAEQYDLDGIVFDDYFYPYDGGESIDAFTYKNYNSGNLTLQEWRRRNINRMIAGARQQINAANARHRRHIRFGISPFGIWGNRKDRPGGSLTGGKEGYAVLAADSLTWIKNGWIDYIAPQIYWPFGHEVAAYAALADWWSDAVKGTPVKLYIAHAVHPLGGSGAWSKDELVDQLLYDSRLGNVRGELFFSYRRVFKPDNAVMRTGVQRVLWLWRTGLTGMGK